MWNHARGSRVRSSSPSETTQRRAAFRQVSSRLYRLLAVMTRGEIHRETGDTEIRGRGLLTFFSWILVGPERNVKRSLREHFTFRSEWKISLSNFILVPQTVRSPSFVPRPSGGGARLDLPTTSLRLSPSHARSCDDERCRVTRAALRPSPAAGKDASACAEQARRIRRRLKFASKTRQRFARGDEGPGRNRSKAAPSRLPVSCLPVNLLLEWASSLRLRLRARDVPRSDLGASDAALGLTSCNAMRPRIRPWRLGGSPLSLAAASGRLSFAVLKPEVRSLRPSRQWCHSLAGS